MLSWRRHATRETLDLIRELNAEENRLRAQLGIDPVRPVTLTEDPSLEEIAPAPVRRPSRGRRVRGLLLIIASGLALAMVLVPATGAWRDRQVEDPADTTPRELGPSFGDIPLRDLPAGTRVVFPSGCELDTATLTLRECPNP